MRRIVYALAICCLVLAGCGTKKPQTMKLSLESNPTTGYSWTVTQDPELFQVEEKYEENEHEEGMTGVGGKQIFSLNPQKAGKTDLKFVYARSWEGSEGDAEEVNYEVEVSKDMQIKVNGTSYAGGEDINQLPQVPEPVIQ